MQSDGVRKAITSTALNCLLFTLDFVRASCTYQSRNLLDLQSLVQQLTGKGVTVEFIKEHRVFKPGEQDSMSTLLFSIGGGLRKLLRSAK